MPRAPKFAFPNFSFLHDPMLQTGLRADILEYVFSTYCGRGTPIPNRKALADLMHYLRHYPSHNYNAAALRSGRKSPTNVSVRLGKMIDFLADNVDELLDVQRSRFSPINVLPEEAFGPYVTGQLDTFPVVIQRPRGPEDQQRLYYASAFECICDF